MNKTFLLSLALLFLISPALTFDDHVCDHDNHDFVVEKIDVQEDLSARSGRLLAHENYPKMRIVANYDNLDEAPNSFKAYIENELAPPVLDYIANALPVKYPLINELSVSSSTVCDVRTPSDLRSGVVADLYIIFDSRVEDSSTVASSRYCQASSSTNRPLVTYTNFNRNMIREAKGDVLLHEKNMYLLIHEIMHTLGISKNSYEDYIDENGDRRENHIKTIKIGGVSQTVIDIPELTQRLRNFYDCPSVPGLIMENDGSTGTQKSHVERKFFPYETMSSGGVYGRRVSEFSLALLEGSGWYVPNYSYAEPFFFGKGQGCDFLYQKCSNSQPLFSEFCTGGGRACAPQGRSGGKCAGDSKTNGCKFVEPDVDYDCDNSDGEDYARFPDVEVYGRGKESKCFTGNLNTRKSSGGSTSFCLKYKCVGQGANQQVEINLGTDKIICDSAGKQSVDGYFGSIDCPDPQTFCEGPGKRYCPRGCMGRGTCIDNMCQCNQGFAGIDCGLAA